MCWEYFRWAKDVAFSPAKNTKRDYRYGEFVKRLALVSLVSGVLSAVWIPLSILVTVGRVDLDAAMWFGIFSSVPIFLIAAVIGPFISAAVTHFFGKIVFRLMRKDYKKTYNASAYSMVPRMLFAWIPVAGVFVAGIWGLIVYVYALANQQKISRGRALLVILIPIIIVVAIVLVLGLIAASFVAGALFGPEMMEAMLANSGI